MARKRIVVALGGNALGKTPEEQLSLITHTAETIVDLIEAGEDVIVTHGNGPQVGMIKVATDTAHEVAGTASIPFPECGAMSQGYIGYHLQQAIDGELSKRGFPGSACRSSRRPRWRAMTPHSTSRRNRWAPSSPRRRPKKK